MWSTYEPTIDIYQKGPLVGTRLEPNIVTRPEPLEKKICSMSHNFALKSLMSSYGLNISNVTWEDTARNKNSCWGPNISDMTLVVNNTRMPVIRRPNFADVTVDHTINNFNVTVGNESNNALKRTQLTEYLENIKKYTNNDKIKTPMFNKDEKILCSTQACLLPAEKNEVNFNVTLFNYQSTVENPAVLVIIASNQGTSAMILNNKTTDIDFNKNGRAHDFIAERLKEERIRLGKNTEDPMTDEEKQRNVLFIYQIPLKYKQPNRQTIFYNNMPFKSLFSNSNSYSNNVEMCNLAESCDSLPTFESFKVNNKGSSTDHRMVGSFKEKKAGLDNAMLRVSNNDKGMFKGVGNNELERDFNYPIRCTLQYYWITDTEILTEEQIKQISKQLEVFYEKSENKSSLVFSNTERPTEPNLNKNYDLPNNIFNLPLNSNI